MAGSSVRPGQGTAEQGTDHQFQASQEQNHLSPANPTRNQHDPDQSWVMVEVPAFTGQQKKAVGPDVFGQVDAHRNFKIPPQEYRRASILKQVRNRALEQVSRAVPRLFGVDVLIPPVRACELPDINALSLSMWLTRTGN